MTKIFTKLPSKWADLDQYQREIFATELVATTYFPPQLAITDEKDVEKADTRRKADRKNKRNRKRARRALLAHEFGARLEAFRALFDKEKTTREQLKAVPQSLFQIWKPNFVDELQRAHRLYYIDEKVPRKRWKDWRDLYLFAAAKIRLRNAGRPDTRRRSMSFLIKSRELEGIEGHKESHIDKRISENKSVWPLICALVQLLSEAREVLPIQVGTSMHRLAVNEPPTSRELVRIIVDNPGRFLAACKYFLNQLSAKSALKQQHNSPMTLHECVEFPEFQDLASTFVPPKTLLVMDSNEQDITSKYKYTDYKRRGAIGNTAKAPVHS
jgi:hypothetical protein